MILPGWISATKNSGLPLPLPIRTSAGFCDTGLSGKMRIQIRPPRLIWRVIARRAASICRAVSRPRPTAFSPYSPKETLWPTVATPLLRPFCSLRYLRLVGCSMLRSCWWRRAARTLRRLGRRCRRRRRLGVVREHLALEHPHLDSDHTVRRARLGKAVFDVRAQRMQRHAAFAVPLRARDLRAVQPSRRHDLDALRAEAHRVLHGPLHRARSEEHTSELQSHHDLVCRLLL